ncbi:MAG: carboxypeptidase regulatory-like domain-containing protein [Acidobacteria bacterium]|nr:carboxypeptidase regulatory-like domain-containing protein [Acidobacteriota bacterium]MBI3427765.1 carboxypeptidase regulatory-like domain-containing protein [Acidobacteriota bacterium]
MKRITCQFTWLLLLCWFSLSVPAPSQTPAPANNAKLTGRVVGTDGEPLPDITVTLYQIGGSSASGSTASDDEGQFSFDGLTTGQYSLNAYAPGYTMQRPSTSSFHPGDTATLTMVKGGVITGRVTNALGEPVVAVSVAAQMIRNATGRLVEGSAEQTQPTDDRGIYRLYGLREGTYLVVANGPSQSAAPLSAYQNETPTYHPAADRATAQEIIVKLGEEASGIDIRYRGERGHQLSGKVAGATAPSNAGRGGINLVLKQVGSEASYNTATLSANSGETDFSFQAVPEGEYELTAVRYENPLGNLAQAAPRRVQVKGADVTGITLTLLPLGSLAGRVITANPPVSPAPESKCTPPSPPVLEEVSITARRMETGQAGETAYAYTRLNAKGEFVLRGLAAGAYWPLVSARTEGWYLRALTLLPAADRGAREPLREIDLGRTGLPLKPGEDLSGITLMLAPGAANLWGRLVAAEGNALPEQARVYLMPAEAAAADDLVRYAETLVMDKAGRFGFNRVAPGRYRLYAEAVTVSALRPPAASFAVGDRAVRARLLRLAATQPDFELQACEQMTNVEVRLSVGK